MPDKLPLYRWKSTNYQVGVEAPVPDLERSRRLAWDEPAPPDGTEIGSGHLRAFVPDRYLKVGEVKFNSGSILSPWNKIDFSGVDGHVLSCNPESSEDELYVFRGKPRDCHALLKKIQENQVITNHAVGQGLKTATRNAVMVGGSLSTIFILAGTLVAGPAGAVVAGAGATALGLIVGGVSGVLQAIALNNANRDEKALAKALKAWIAYTDPSPVGGDMNTTAAKMFF